jgi:hypothetical protein
MLRTEEAIVARIVFLTHSVACADPESDAIACVDDKEKRSDKGINCC